VSTQKYSKLQSGQKVSFQMTVKRNST